jgi:mRNA interferase MazF
MSKTYSTTRAVYNDYKTVWHRLTRGDVYFADLDGGFGSEQIGTRPVVVLQNDVGNKHSPTTIIAAVSSRTDKKDIPTHILLEHYLARPSIVLLEQIRTIDKRRLKSYITTLDSSIMNKIDAACEIAIGLNRDYVRK